jgi:hypothetical protein
MLVQRLLQERHLLASWERAARRYAHWPVSINFLSWNSSLHFNLVRMEYIGCLFLALWIWRWKKKN